MTPMTAASSVIRHLGPIGSLTSYLMYKGFSLNANFGYSLGAAVYNSTLASRVEGTTPKQTRDRRVLESRWEAGW